MGVEQPKPQGHGATPQNRGMQQGKHSDRNKDKKSEPQLDNTQLITALNQTWSGFNSQVGRDYSTLTLNLPKKR